MKEARSHVNKLVKGTGLFIIFGIYGYIITFLFKLILARHFGSSDFGLFVLAQTIFGIAVLIAGLGIKESITRYIPYYITKKKYATLTGYVYFIFIFPLFFSLFFSILLFIFSKDITSFFNFPNKFVIFLKIIAFILPFSIFNATTRKIFLAEHKTLYTTISYYAIEMSLLLFGAILVIYLDLQIWFIVLMMLLSILIAAMYDVVIYKRNIFLPLTSKKEFFFKDWLKFSLPLFFTGIFAYLISWSDNIVIGKLLDPGQLGVYSICYSLAIFLVFFQKSFSNLFIPIISKNYAKKEFGNITLLFKHASAWTFGLTFPFFLILLLFSKQILSILYGKEFIAGSGVLIILSLGALINISTGLNKEILLVYKKTKFIFFVNVLIAIFNVIANIIMIPFFGIMGAAIASAVSISSQNLIFLYKAKQYQKLTFDFKYLLKFCIAGFPSIFIAKFVFHLFTNKILAILFAGIIYLISYILLLLLMKTPTKEDIKILLAIEKKLGLNLKFIKKLLRKIY